MNIATYSHYYFLNEYQIREILPLESDGFIYKCMIRNNIVSIYNMFHYKIYPFLPSGHPFLNSNIRLQIIRSINLLKDLEGKELLDSAKKIILMLCPNALTLQKKIKEGSYQFESLEVGLSPIQVGCIVSFLENIRID